MFCATKCQALPIEITPEGYDLEQIECLMRTEKPKLFYMNPTFQNPTGYTVPTNQRKALVELTRNDINAFWWRMRSITTFILEIRRRALLLRYRGLCHSHSKLQQICGPWLADIGAGGTSGADECHPADQGAVGQRDAALTQKIFQHYFFSSRLQEHVAKRGLPWSFVRIRWRSLSLQNGDGTAPAVA